MALDPAEVIDEVNTWAEVHTNVLINQILSKDSIEVIPQSTVIFPNAVYIKGAWSEKFNRINGDSPCIFILPILEKDCPTLLEKVGSEPGFLDNHIPDYQIELADFRIPKFKFSFEFEASGSLTEMVDSPTIGEKLYVSNILYKACIEVDEEVTEAAAVSIDVVTNSRDTVTTRMKRIVSLTCTYHNCGLRFGLYVARTFATHRPHMSKETLISRDANLPVLRFSSIGRGTIQFL
uniref:Serpin domain-containing protein n=1 Tax=Brassica oleracea var. oleracea TaxID=109376 RepID=A0A0D3DRR9_BRAOL